MKKLMILSLLLAMLLPLLPQHPAAAAPTDNWQLVWSDEFSGANGSAPDSSKWNFVNQGGGFGNSELQYYTNRRDNSYLENGSLVIVAKKESYGFHSLQSKPLSAKSVQRVALWAL